MGLKVSRLLFTILLFTTISVGFSSAFAQTSKNQYAFTIDAVALAQQGVGLKFDYAYNENVTIGVFGKQYKSDSEGLSIKSKDPTKYEFSEVGISTTYYYTSVFVTSGYVSFGYAAGENNITYNDPVYGISSDGDSNTGIQIKLGYQFSGELNKNHNLIFQFGIGYGAAGDGKWANDDALIEQIQAQLDPGSLIDFNVGMTY